RLLVDRHSLSVPDPRIICTRGGNAIAAVARVRKSSFRAAERMPTTVQAPPPAYDLKPYKSLSNDELTSRINTVRLEVGPKLLILGHHDQQDEVTALSDLRGDSNGLSQNAADSSACRVIVFCGVHFMAETADILANRPEKLTERAGERVPVILPDLAAG